MKREVTVSQIDEYVYEIEAETEQEAIKLWCRKHEELCVNDNQVSDDWRTEYKTYLCE